MKRTRVLIADDSAFARKVLREILGADPRLEVVGVAHDGLEALELIAQLSPDVVTLDLVMPNLDGIGVLRTLAKRHRPSFVVVSISGADSELGLEALEAGAVDIVHKPTALATSRMYEMSKELVEKVLAAAEARALDISPPSRAPFLSSRGTIEVVVIGASTGGPAALRALMGGMPAGFSIPLVIALHIPAGYTEALARRLTLASTIGVEEALEGRPIVAGTAVLAPGGLHLMLARDEAGVVCTHLSRSYQGSIYRPSVDALFASAAEVCGAAVLGVVLTGMGNDGLEGSRAIRAAGGVVISEAASSAVIYGMPRCVWEAKLSVEEAPIHEMAKAIVRCCAGAADSASR